MRLLTREQAKMIDERASSEYSIPSEDLMNQAGLQSSKWIHEHLLKKKDQSSFRSNFGAKILILIGPGHNGGDGWVVASQLQECGYHDLEVFVPIEKQNPSDLWRKKRDQYSGRIIREWSQLNHEPRLIIDAFFGIGLDRPLNETCLKVITNLNELVKKIRVSICSSQKASQIEVVSLDIPSGLDANTGNSWGSVVQSDFTISFGRPKIGLFVNDGPLHCGKILNFSIGLPKNLLKTIGDSYFLFESKRVSDFLPQRNVKDNKSKGGKALLIAGSSRMPGAASLAAESCARIGAGYTALSALDLNPLWPSDFLRLNLIDVKKEKGKYTVIGMGPGIGYSDIHFDLLQDLMAMQFPRVVLDADGLTLLVKLKNKAPNKFETPFKLPSDWLLTPHAGELQRLLKDQFSVTSQEIEQDRFKWVSIAAQVFGCWVLLKGFRTVISNGVKTFVIETGNPALAKSGTGDVLTGMIVGLMAQGLSTPMAALVGSTLHGKLADLWVKSGRDPISLLATDLVRYLPKYIAKLS